MCSAAARTGTIWWKIWLRIFDRTTILSFRCRPAKTIYEDHVSLLKAIEQKDAAAAHRIAGQHMQRYTENLSAIREAFPHYFKA